jgi:cytochrome c
VSEKSNSRVLTVSALKLGTLAVLGASVLSLGAAFAADGLRDAEILERIKPVGQVNVAKAAKPAAAKPAAAAAPAPAASNPVQAAASMVGKAVSQVAGKVEEAASKVAQAVTPAAGGGDDAQALAQAKGCLGCHAVDHKIVGPAYKDVAAKYKGDAGALDRLAAKVQSGGAGNWGQVPMPPNNVTDAEAKKLVSWVLSR